MTGELAAITKGLQDMLPALIGLLEIVPMCRMAVLLRVTRLGSIHIIFTTNYTYVPRTF